MYRLNTCFKQIKVQENNNKNIFSEYLDIFVACFGPDYTVIWDVNKCCENK